MSMNIFKISSSNGEDNVKTRMAAKSDEELLEIVEQEYRDYTPEALDLAREELNRRNIPFIDRSANHSVKAGQPEEEILCPQCTAPMKPGNAYLESAFGGFFVSRLFAKHCFFQPDETGQKRFKIIANAEIKRAYYCKSCGLIMFKVRR